MRLNLTLFVSFLRMNTRERELELYSSWAKAKEYQEAGLAEAK